MTTEKSGSAVIYLGGSGMATVDWGDGTENSIKELSSISFANNFYHNYTGSNTRTIKIFGNDVTYLRCFNLELTSLDVSENPALERLEIDFNLLTDLDVSKNPVLTWLICSNNLLTSLDVSKNTVLTRLDFGGNNIITFDVSKNSALINLGCSNNSLKSLDVSGATSLSTLRCQYNQLTDAALDDLFHSLPFNESFYTIYIRGNPGVDNCNQSIATEKGWIVNNSYN